MITVRKRDNRIPRKPFLWLTAALLFTLPPMFESLAIWVPAIFLVTLAAKFWMEPRDYRLRSPIWKLILGAMILGAVFATYGSVNGIEPGVSIVAVLMSLKILEAHTAREFHVMVAMGWILCLCGFFLSQDLAIALCLFAAFMLLVAALIQFYRGVSSPRWSVPLRTAAKLLAQAAPVILLLFLFFPRINAGVRFQLGQGRFAAAGFSGQLSPGSVSSLTNSSNIAFRAEFPDGRIPRPSEMYWRGVVMRQGNGFEWRANDAPAAVRRRNAVPAKRATFRQWITIEPHGGHWLFALDWPTDPPSGVMMAPGDYLWSPQPIRKPRKYEVRSGPEIHEKDLRPRERKMSLEVPPWITPAVRQLAGSWTTGAVGPMDVVKRGLRFFQTQGFRYSLSPGEYKRNDLDEFLFRRRTGFCEHYAAAFATLMRVAGIPTRVVAGYLGGEYNDIGHFFVVRQADAHAWCEVWVSEAGWIRIDPIAVVAPERVNLGLNAFLERGAATGQIDPGRNLLVRNLTRSPLFTRVRLAWQTLNYEWDAHVLSFDGEAQESFLGQIGLADHGPLPVMALVFVIVVSLLALYATWTRLKIRVPRDRVKKLYEEFCSKTARLGVARLPAEGPLDFSNRAAAMLPNKSGHIRKIGAAYVSLRYASDVNQGVLEAFASEVAAFGTSKLPD